jgi:hypothetical protein
MYCSSIQMIEKDLGKFEIVYAIGGLAFFSLQLNQYGPVPQSDSIIKHCY